MSPLLRRLVGWETMTLFTLDLLSGYISGTPWDQPFKILQSVLRETLFFVQLHPSVLPWLEIQHCQPKKRQSNCYDKNSPDHTGMSAQREDDEEKEGNWKVGVSVIVVRPPPHQISSTPHLITSIQGVRCCHHWSRGFLCCLRQTCWIRWDPPLFCHFLP